MKPFITLIACLAASTLLAWEAPKCPQNLVKYLPAGEMYWCHTTKGTITALASRLETEKIIAHHMTIINQTENRIYPVYQYDNYNGKIRLMDNYEIFNIRIISPTEIEYSVEDAGITMVYHIQWNDKEKKYIQDSSRMAE